MRKNHLVLFGLLLLTIQPLFAQRSNCGVNPTPHTISQADGSKLTLYPFGNEAVNYLETPGGYTVLFNKATGNYEYAQAGETGNLELSGIMASDKQDNQMSKLSTIQPHLRYSRVQEQMLTDYFNQETQIQEEFGKAGANVFPPNGERKVLVLMVEYPDLRATIPQSEFVLLMNQKNYGNTGSYRDYFEAATKNRLKLTSDIYGWFMADSGYKYYGKTSSPSYGTATRKLLVGALNDADSSGVDFTQYDSDNDGYADAVILIHAGQGAEESSAPNSGNYIWSFRSTLSSTQSPTLDGKKFAAYCMFPEKLWNGGSPVIVGIGVIAHEFGHILDLPDLYSTQYNNNGAGHYTIMAGGCWLNNQRTPSLFDAWSREALGWTNSTVITDIGTYTIPYSVTDSNMTYRINTKSASEYFLLENRQRKGFDKYLPSRGLAVWHINTNFAGKLTQKSNNVNNDTSSLGVHLLQADGLREMERNINQGNAGDLFPDTVSGKPRNRNITPFTKPSTNLHKTYQSTNIYITNITMNPDSSISFRFSSQPSSAFTLDRMSGCAPLTVKYTNNSTAAASFKWNYGNGNTSTTEVNPIVVYNEAGSYQVSLTVFDTLGNPVDSISSTVQVYPSPVAGFTVTQSGNQLTLVNASTGSNSVQWQYYKGATSYSSSSNTLNITVPDTGLFSYKLTAYNNYGCSDTALGNTYAFPTALNEQFGLVKELTVYPNPFTSEVKAVFVLPQATPVSFGLFTLLGEEISARPAQQYTAGKQTVSLSDLFPQRAGVYFLRIRAGEENRTIRVIRTN